MKTLQKPLFYIFILSVIFIGGCVAKKEPLPIPVINTENAIRISPDGKTYESVTRY